MLRLSRAIAAGLRSSRRAGCRRAGASGRRGSRRSSSRAAVRELREESGLALSAPHFLAAYRWEAQIPERFTRQVCSAFAFAAPEGLPQTWIRQADGYRFAFRWADLSRPELDWEMDAALPHLHTFLAESHEPHHQNRSLAHD
ncbi:NUDIX domain-containing protein [Deinococcus oregonensis]|uniref:NUDIX domain-containing protein n=1 Tax=Deinococcus oregonensis TaxID=1805970 RepID=A0ABV6B3X5_9DEIO